MRNRAKQRIRAGTAALAILTLLVLGPSSAALADDLAWESDITYSADLEANLLHVHAEMTITNITPNTTSGGVTTQYYYEGIALLIPDTAQNVSATTPSGGILGLEVEPTEDDELENVVLANIDFARNLFYRSSTTVVLDYDIPGDPPRTESVFRVNPAYVSFGAFGWGDPGDVDIRITLPSSFEVDFAGFEPAVTPGDENVTYEFNDVEDPGEFFVWVQGWDESGMIVSESGLDEFDIVVKAWPDDPEWNDQVLETVRKGLPVLSQLVGLEWRPTEPLHILESQDVALLGYAGWYIDESQEVHIGEWIDPHLVLHELSHTWFDGDLFGPRWINEGLADEFAAAAVEAAGLESIDYPRLARAPAPYDNFTTLNDWEIADFEVLDDQFAYEEYGYGTSFWVIQELASEIGHDSLADVLAAAEAGEVAYRAGGNPETWEDNAGVEDWQRFLDLLQEVGGSEKADEIFAEFVTDESLDERAEVRESYDELTATGWDTPFYVRDALEDWDLDSAALRIDEANSIIDTRDEIYILADEAGVHPPDSLEAAYEGASGSLEEASLMAETNLVAVNNVLEAVERTTAKRDLLTTIGLIGDDPEAELNEVLAAFENDEMERANVEAAEISEIFEQAPERGKIRLGIAIGTLVLLALASVLWIRYRRSKASDEVSMEDPAEMEMT